MSSRQLQRCSSTERNENTYVSTLSFFTKHNWKSSDALHCLLEKTQSANSSNRNIDLKSRNWQWILVDLYI